MSELPRKKDIYQSDKLRFAGIALPVWASSTVMYLENGYKVFC